MRLTESEKQEVIAALQKVKRELRNSAEAFHELACAIDTIEDITRESFRRAWVRETQDETKGEG